MENIGLVFCGGGAKGAYQVGVIRVLEEFGLCHNVQAISGASIGGINGALFLQFTPEEIEDFWIHCPWSSVFSISKENMKRMSQIIDSMNQRQLSPFFGMINLATVANTVGLPLKRTGFEKAFRYYLNPGLIQQSKIDLYISCGRLKTTERHYFKLNKLNSKQMKEVLLATTAIPILYEPVKIGENYYVDPVKYEKVPIRPLLGTDCDTIIIVYTNPYYKINKSMIEGKRIIEISPTRELGNGIYGACDFRPSVLKYYMDLGSDDAYRVLYRTLSEHPKTPQRVVYKNHPKT